VYYTQAKYLRRVKDGPKGLVIPTLEKNLFIRIDEARIKSCSIVPLEETHDFFRSFVRSLMLSLLLYPAATLFAQQLSTKSRSRF